MKIHEQIYNIFSQNTSTLYKSAILFVTIKYLSPGGVHCTKSATEMDWAHNTCAYFAMFEDDLIVIGYCLGYQTTTLKLLK